MITLMRERGRQMKERKKERQKVYKERDIEREAEIKKER